MDSTGTELSGLLWWLSSKEEPASAGDTGLTPAQGRSLGDGNGNPLQYSGLGNSMDRGAWWLQSMESQIGHG